MKGKSIIKTAFFWGIVTSIIWFVIGNLFEIVFGGMFAWLIMPIIIALLFPLIFILKEKSNFKTKMKNYVLLFVFFALGHLVIRAIVLIAIGGP